MTLKDLSVLDDKNNYTRPTSTIIVRGDLLDNGRQLLQLQNNNNNTEEAATIDITKAVSEEEKHLVKEAGHGGAVLGFLVGGPIGSALLGFGSAYAIRKPKDSTLGKSSRSLAELTISLKEKAKGVEEKHHFVKRSKTTIDQLCGDTTNDDNNNDHANRDNDDTNNKNEKSHSNIIASKTRSIIVSGWDSVSQYTKKNQLIEQGVEGTGKGIEYLDDAISNFRSGKNNKFATEKND